MKRFIRSSTLAGATLLALPAAAQIQPAGYTEGFVRSVDVRQHTLALGAETYTVGNSTTTRLADIQPGDAVEVQYIVQGGRWIALDVRKTGERAGFLLFNATK